MALRTAQRGRVLAKLRGRRVLAKLRAGQRVRCRSKGDSRPCQPSRAWPHRPPLGQVTALQRDRQA